MEPSDRMDRIERRECTDFTECGTEAIAEVYHRAGQSSRAPSRCERALLGWLVTYGTTTIPTVGRKLQVIGAAPSAWVVREPEITARTRPRPVSAMADRVAGPS